MILTYLWRILLVLIPSALAAVYGVLVIYRRTHGLYFRIPTLAMACLLMGQCCYLARYLSDGSAGMKISIGFLGALGCTLFFLCQNISSVTNMFYDFTQISKKHKLLSNAFAGFVFVFAILAECLRWKDDLTLGTAAAVTHLVIRVLLACFAAFTLYRTVAFSTVQDDSISCLRGYNLSLSVFMILTLVEQYLRDWEFTSTAAGIVQVVLYVCYAISILTMMPLMERGRSKFLTL